MIEQLNKKHFLSLSLIVGFAVSILFPPLIFPDSDGYIKYDSLRSLCYPLFISILRKKFETCSIYLGIFNNIIMYIFFITN